MIDSFDAREAAQNALVMMQMRDDALSVPWREALLGEPLLVHTVQRQPSYWLVPVVRGSTVLGSIEIGGDGALWGQSYFYCAPDFLDDCPSTVTRITESEAHALAAPILARHCDAEFSPALYVHIGHRNRLAWMIEIRRAGVLYSRVFITPAQVWEAPADDSPPPPGVRGN
jgi:hypothetical protein